MISQISLPLWLSVLLLGLALAVSAAPVQEVDSPPADVTLTGSLERVNNGQVSPWDLTTIDPAGAVAGLGAGTLKRLKNTGDMMSFAGRTFLRTVDPKQGVKLVEVTGQKIQSPFALTIAPAMLRDPKTKEFVEVFPRTLRIDGTEPQLLHSLLEQLALQVNGPIGVLGWVDMPDLDGIALQRAPINDESLTGANKGEYLEAIHRENAHVVFFAVVAPALKLSPLSNSLLTANAFDYNPDEGMPNAALVHMHGAIVEEAAPESTPYLTTPILLKKLQKVTVTDILHVYGASTLQRGVLMVYRLQYPPAK